MSRSLEWEITRATPEMAEALTGIAFAAKRYWGYPEEMIRTWATLLTISPRYIETSETYALCEDRKPVAFYSTITNGDSKNLEHLWVSPDRIRRGCGTALFRHAVSEARKANRRALRIEADPNASGFYIKMGAARIGTVTTRLGGEIRELPVFEFVL